MAQNYNGESGQADVGIPNVTTVGHAQVIVYRHQDEIVVLKRTITNLEQQLD